MKPFDAALRALLRMTLGAVLLLSTVVCFAQTPLLDQANAKYKEGDFKGAVVLYQKLLETGRTTATVYFNMGNAALKAGEKGQALVYYERARKAAPRDPDLEWNLHTLKGMLKDRIEDRSHFALAAAREFLEKWSVSEVAFLFTGLLALCAVLALAGAFVPAFAGRANWLRVPLWFALILSAALFGWKIWETKDPYAVVLDHETPAFYGPSERETKAFTLHEGAEGRVLDTSGDWIYLSLDGKTAGWIRKNSCEIV